MTWLKFGIAALTFSFGVSAAAAFEIVDSNNGFAGPAFTQILAEQGSDNTFSSSTNTHDFSDAHIFLRRDNEEKFDGYSYSGFVFEDQLQTPSNLVSIDQSSIESVPDASEIDPKH
jgi:hypothetical protein